jgi:hypothetical protein
MGLFDDFPWLKQGWRDIKLHLLGKKFKIVWTYVKITEENNKHFQEGILRL